ncbi:hypothetical protein NUU61_001598 [Penicillium alfredii]|uniref:Uncharacterized protein n=1 Tax=Penicillium alfredii TaxID=1506179 RepID=A0A9W9KLP9_9EURO|nr:uncharacterized protein NUU61_001598 [Penicillium alfredii]KAJ5110341.1 hypothetical protein NUU61_001598 [Penicillium alfredii]
MSRGSAAGTLSQQEIREEKGCPPRTIRDAEVASIVAPRLWQKEATKVLMKFAHRPFPEDP